MSNCARLPTGMNSPASAAIMSTASSTVGSCPENHAGTMASATTRAGFPAAPSTMSPSTRMPCMTRLSSMPHMSSSPSKSAPHVQPRRDSTQQGYHIIPSSSSEANCTASRRMRAATAAISSGEGIHPSGDSSPTHRSGPRSQPATSHAQRRDASAVNQFPAERAVGWPVMGFMNPAPASMPTTSWTTDSSAPIEAAKSWTATAPANSWRPPEPR